MKTGLDDPILRQQPPFFYQNYHIITAAIFSFPQVKLWIIVDYLFIYYLFLVNTAQISSLSK